ncbi:MAG: hypothetical protein HY317_00715 [Acidobacteria bacterium]|nr:hypothetical protein [Acidobacteriota bacterium]
MAEARAEARSGSVVPACLFAWLVPGAGHLYLGRRGRAGLFFGTIVALFALGVTMDARLELHLGLDDPLAFVIGVGQVMTGLPYFLARSLGHVLGDVKSATYDYGLTFTAVGGLLNVLVILDVHDIAVGRKS